MSESDDQDSVDNNGSEANTNASDASSELSSAFQNVDKLKQCVSALLRETLRLIEEAPSKNLPNVPTAPYNLRFASWNLDMGRRQTPKDVHSA